MKIEVFPEVPRSMGLGGSAAMAVAIVRALDKHFRLRLSDAEVNRLAPDLPGSRPAYQFEICEKPVVRLPPAFATDSMVVMDGPFMCFDPLAETFVEGWQSGEIEPAARPLRLAI